MSTIISVAPELAAMFRGGMNIRVRHADGHTFIKPTSRRYAVRAEFAFAALQRCDNGLAGHISEDVPHGSFNVEPQRYGWFKLVPGEGITLSGAPLIVPSDVTLFGPDPAPSSPVI